MTLSSTLTELGARSFSSLTNSHLSGVRVKELLVVSVGRIRRNAKFGKRRYNSFCVCRIERRVRNLDESMKWNMEISPKMDE
jgi:hypothetical protein